MNRRRLISLLGLAPVAAPLAVKAMAESATANLAGLAGGAAQGIGGAGGAPSNAPSNALEVSRDQARIALMNPATLREVETLIFERERRIGFIDPDIACHRSFSLNAKIVFQRRRNVAREIDQMKSEYPWSRMQKLLRGGLSLLS